MTEEYQSFIFFNCKRILSEQKLRHSIYVCRREHLCVSARASIPLYMQKACECVNHSLLSEATDAFGVNSSMMSAWTLRLADSSFCSATKSSSSSR